MATRPPATGSAITVTVVVADLVASSVEVAVMVTVPATAGAVQAPVPGVMVPALADQVMPLVTPPVAVAPKVVAVLIDRVAPAGLTAPTATVCGVTVRFEVLVVPAALVTVRTKALAAVMVPLGKVVPLVTTPTPWSTLPVPPLKVGVTGVLLP